MGSKPAGPGAVAAGGLKSTSTKDEDEATPSKSLSPSPSGLDEPVESFAATGLDDALEMLSIVNAKTDQASVGQDAARLEAHPEARCNG